MFYRVIDDHLALKLASPLDAEEAFAVIDRNREHLRSYIPFVNRVHTVDDERAMLESLIVAWPPTKGIDTWITVDGRIVGGVCFPRMDYQAHWVEIGYWIDSAFEGRGYVSRCVREMESIAFAQMDIERIEISTEAGNIRSRAVAERLGFTLDGILRRQLVSPETGELVDHCVYSLLRDEWEAREAG